jgi:hypothetical protein
MAFWIMLKRVDSTKGSGGQGFQGPREMFYGKLAAQPRQVKTHSDFIWA